MSTKIPRRELPNGKIWVPCCPECTAISEHTCWPKWCPREGGAHQAGQIMWRDDTFHEVDCPLLPAESGFAPLAGLSFCDRCTPILWFDALPGNITRLELRHADDCHAAAAEMAALVGVG
jgi:hypothetical protein